MMFLDGSSNWMVQNELLLPKIIREFRCDDLDTPHAYILTKAACDQKWSPLKGIVAQKAPFGPWWLEKGSNIFSVSVLGVFEPFPKLYVHDCTY